MITRFLRKRNPNTALPYNKNFVRIQVSGNLQTFKAKKTVTSQTQGDRILTESGNFLNTESGDRLTIN